MYNNISAIRFLFVFVTRNVELMKRDLFDVEHHMFRESFRTFVAREILPNYDLWEQQGLVAREVWPKAGAQGFLCMDVPEQFGGAGISDFCYHAIIAEELARAGVVSVGFGLHTDIVVPYLLRYTTTAQKERWLPQIARGECITAIAMTEPNAGSDLAGIRTTAIRKGNHYVLNGQKTFISNGILNDLVIVAAKTDLTQGHRGMSLLVVEQGMAGYERGRNLEKIGLHAQDTAELFFNDVPVPVDNLLGEEGQGFGYLMQQLPQERLSIAVSAIAGAEAAFEWTVQYCRERQAFGQPISSLQHTRFKLAEMKTEIQIGRVFIDRCILTHNAGELTTEDASMAKWWATKLQKRVVDQCLQLHGGYGYMREYPISRAYLDARIQTIYGGTTEIMKEIIGRSLEK
ncbi:MAG: Butyryl-CoA dehydrogenase [Chloroflexi bacterium AL-W]|nr:Butyryl-CoA dehydrogenase [Chloroflexi bacterium AL-N1]NOK69368.1 Butyryl-CoA dehydrogenase [Chloroflexi bacterium AL-N10]NOK76429.1 Butyryl-CoA dehydrogenase [Chloroflexi bacterium AL-N5]NOK83546.1 Butyryl-CoA dehydrogenase [Chloroflexi bacterium AL-W]NOK91206.1 Butyryl-CoA dehydrogenase [Chloroflexi bacterium AL-N15]